MNLVTIFCGLIIVIPWLTAVVGEPIIVVIDGKTETAHATGSHSYQLQFHYDDQGETIHETQPMTVAEYTNANAPGSKVDARAVSVLGYHSALTGEATPKAHNMVLLAGIGWIVLTTAVWLITARNRNRWKKLARHGIAVEGKMIASGKTRTPGNYLLRYEYATLEGLRCEYACTVRRSFYEQFPLGSSVTVLYAKSSPLRGRLYELGMFDVLN